MELRQYLVLIWHKLWLIVFFLMLGLAMALVVCFSTTPVYQSSTKLLINPVPTISGGVDYNALLASERLAKNYVQILSSRPVLSKVIENLKLKIDLDSLLKHVNFNAVRDTQLIIITVQSSNSQEAATIANEIVKEFKFQNQKIQAGTFAASKETLQTELEDIQTQIKQAQDSIDVSSNENIQNNVTERSRLSSLLAQYRSDYNSTTIKLVQVLLAEAQVNNNIAVLEEAQAESRPVQPRLTLNLSIGGVLGLISGFGIVFLLNYFDDTLKSKEEISQLLEVPGLGNISFRRRMDKSGELLNILQGNSFQAEEYRILQANLEFARFDKPIQAILVTSSIPGEGKSTTITNLAIALANTGKRVILVDADLRRPVLHQNFGEVNTHGLTTTLITENSSAADYLVSSEVENLKVLTSGPAPTFPVELLGSSRLPKLLSELKQEADLILFDSPPLLLGADASHLARACDATLLVVSSGSTRKQLLKRAKDQLNQTGATLLGFVLNRATPEHGNYYYSYNNTEQLDVPKLPLLPDPGACSREAETEEQLEKD